MTMSRSITFVSCYFSICYLVNGCISQNSIFSNEKEDEAPTDSKKNTESTRSALSIEAEELLKLEGMENAGSDVKRFVKKYIIEKKNYKAELSEKDRRIGALQSEKNSLDKDFHALKIPVLVRTIRDRIQEKWPKPSRCETCLEFGHCTKKCTALQRTLKSNDPGEEKLRETERYWDYLVREHGNEVEMKVLVNELHRAYNNTEMFKQYSYDKYQRTFFRYLGVACRITDSEVHIDLVLAKIKQLNVFGCPIDEFMTPLVRALGYLVDPNIPAVILEHSVETSESTPIGSSSLTTP